MTNTSVQQIRERNAQVDLVGKRAIVVGGTSGIGEGIAMRLAKANVSVSIVGRNARGHEIVRRLQEAGAGQHEFIACDSFLMKNVLTVSNEIKAKYPKIDFLVMSQGMATIQGRTETAEGIDQKLALHYFSRMAFTRELLPNLWQGDGGKVLSVLSGGVHSPYGHWEDDFDLRTHFSIKNAADAAGYYNDLALDGLSKQAANSNVLFLHAAPGFVSTNWGTEMPWAIRMAVRGLQLFGRSADDCGEAMCAPLFEMSRKGFAVIDPMGNEGRLSSGHSQQAMEAVMAKTDQLLGAILNPPAAAAGGDGH